MDPNVGTFKELGGGNTMQIKSKSVDWPRSLGSPPSVSANSVTCSTLTSFSGSPVKGGGFKRWGAAEHRSFINTQNAHPTWVSLLDQIFFFFLVGEACLVKPTLQGLQSHSLWHKPVFGNHRPADV